MATTVDDTAMRFLIALLSGPMMGWALGYFIRKSIKVVAFIGGMSTKRNSTTTLPYYNMYRGGKLWFNGHEGNAMAYFDTANSTLVEYQIPLRGEIWGNTSNPLQFTLDKNSSAWFTEWTENKIGLLDSEKAKNLPLWVSVPANSILG